MDVRGEIVVAAPCGEVSRPCLALQCFPSFIQSHRQSIRMHRCVEQNMVWYSYSTYFTATPSRFPFFDWPLS
jgi:hypothetical protein